MKIFQRQLTAKQGLSIKSLIQLLTDLKVNYKGKIVSRVNMSRMTLDSKKMYEFQMFVEERKR